REDQQPLPLATLAPPPPVLDEQRRDERQAGKDREPRRLIETLSAMENESREGPPGTGSSRVALGRMTLISRPQKWAPPRSGLLPERIRCVSAHSAAF